MTQGVPNEIDALVEDGIDYIEVHPLLLLAGFVAHTAFTVLFAVHVAPMVAGAVGLTVTAMALYWLVFAIITFTMGVGRQRRIT